MQIYLGMHHFVVKFSKKKFRLRRQGGIDPTNQNPPDPPADVPLSVTTMSPTETVELVEMTFVMWTRIPREAAFKV